MLVVTARLFKDNQLVGYQLSDGNRTKEFTKQQAWLYAKSKQIINVVATGTQDDPGLSGTNGFELKKLPEVKWQDTSKKKYTKEEMPTVKQLDKHPELLGKNLLVERVLYDSNEGPMIRGIIHAIGYKIVNIGDKPIEYNIIIPAQYRDRRYSKQVLQKGEYTYLSCAELGYLAFNENVGLRFANGRVYYSVPARETYDKNNIAHLYKCYFHFDGIEISEDEENYALVSKYIGKKISDQDIRLDIRDVQEIDAYARVERFTVVITPKKEKTNIFNMFKR